MPQSGMLVLVTAVAVLAPRPAYGIGRWPPVPPVISELLPGILVGPDVLGRAGDGQVIDTAFIGTALTGTALEGAVRGSGAC
ncbi:hypothetical protein [Streptomyces sp. NPDC001100]